MTVVQLSGALGGRAKLCRRARPRWIGVETAVIGVPADDKILETVDMYREEKEVHTVLSRRIVLRYSAKAVWDHHMLSICYIGPQ